AGRAGRAGYDTAGTVVVQAPDHETENARLLARAGDDPKKIKRIVRKRAPDGFVSWGEPSFNRLVAAEPETLTSSMQVNHAMVLNVIGRGGEPFDELRELIENNHEPRPRQLELARQALSIYRTLRTAEIVQQDPNGRISLTVDLQPNFALNQPLSPFALAVFDLIQPSEGTERSPSYALDMISVLEATLDDPRPVLSAQQFMARGEAVAAMKNEGIDYEQRMELLEEVTHPKPLEELLDAAFATYRRSQPWVGDFELSPKSVVRDLYERAMTFNDFIGFYKLNRSEGLVLRYLSDAYRAARQTIPDEAKTEELLDLIEWLGELVRQVDSSLLDEWEELINPSAAVELEGPVLPPTPHNVTTNVRAFRILVRNELFRRVQLAALENYEELGELDAAAGFDSEAWADAMDAYFRVHNNLGTGPDARSSAMLIVDEGAERWAVRQIFDDPAGDHDWGISATIDIAESNAAGVAVVRVDSVGML
ncbi:MAG: box helicase, partial [Microbacteriaceae bacterium]|nr:box helicase [Microbacteriaceae bacterium]